MKIRNNSLRLERVLINHHIGNNSIFDESLLMSLLDNTSPSRLREIIQDGLIDNIIERFNDGTSSGMTRHYRTIGVRTNIQLKDAQIGTEWRTDGGDMHIKLMYDIAYNYETCCRYVIDPTIMCAMIRPEGIYPGRAQKIRSGRS